MDRDGCGITWAQKQGIALIHIQPGKPQQNAYVERYNRTVRHEWLDLYILETIKEVQQIATDWLWTHNNERSNMGVGGVTPAMRLKLAERILQLCPVKTGRITAASRPTSHGSKPALKPAIATGANVPHCAQANSHDAVEEIWYSKASRVFLGRPAKATL